MLVFGEPYEASTGTVIITVSRAGRRGCPDRAIGIYTVTAAGATWTPAVDASQLAVLGVSTGLLAAVIGTSAVLRRPPWPELTERVMLALSEVRMAAKRR